MNNKKYLLFQLICIVGIILLSFIDIYMYNNNYFEEKKVTLKYKEDNSIDYKVYLKKNAFFETPYLEKGKTYITSLIKYINVDYNYKIEFDHPVSGEYKYYVSVTLESNKSNNETNYWTKDYIITDEKTIGINGVKQYTVHENIDIDYNKYNSILSSFKKTLGLSTANGIMKVYLNVNSNITGNKVSTPIESKMLIEFPLTEMTIEASVDEDVQNNEKEISKIIDASKVRFYIVLNYIFVGLIIVFFILLFYIEKIKKNMNKYESELKKILNTYDSIIVNIKQLPDISNFNVISVSSFEELLDAHGELRVPINYFKSSYKSYFILISEKTVWMYVMKRKTKGM